MISFVKGILSEVSLDSIVVEAGSIGVSINVPTTVLGQLPPIGNEVKVYTYLKVSEDALTLYGFNTRADLDMFCRIISVSGIGPKGALGILSTLSPNDLRIAIMTGDVKSISKSPGIGAKSAQRMILELKDKVTAADIIGSGDSAATISTSGVQGEAMEALVALGYTNTEAGGAIAGISVDEETSVQDILKIALKKLAR